MFNISLGVFVTMDDGVRYPIRSIGDTLGLTALLPTISGKYNTQIDICTLVPEIFNNNPYVSNVHHPLMHPTDIKLEACTTYECNIIQNYSNQLGISSLINPTPKLYLSIEEQQYAKKQLQEFKDKKKIAVCLKSSADSRDLRYEKILPLLLKLKDQGYILIGVGQDLLQEDEIFDKSFINKTTLREVFSIINECDLYLGVDTGLFHVASAFNVPQVVFFRNNGCSNNQYSNTSYIDSNIKCSDMCHAPAVTNCYIPNSRCMDNFNLEYYYQTINLILS